MKTHEQGVPPESNHADPKNVWLLVFVGTGEDIISRKEEALRKAEQAEEEGHATFEYSASTFVKEQEQDAQPQAMQRARNLAISKHSQGFLTNRYYLSPDVVKAMEEPGARFYADVLQGVGTKTINPINMKAGKMTGKSLFPGMRGYVTGAGENQNVDYVMELLKTADAKEQSAKSSDGPQEKHLPDRIILNGHSRGSVATIALARAIYLEYGDKIKITMNISDPVPGPLRHRESNMVIPPNVDSLVITYAEQSMGSPLIDKMFNPLDLDHLYFDPTKTTVTTTTFPVSHMLSSDAGKEYKLEKYSDDNVIAKKVIRLKDSTTEGLPYEVIGLDGEIKTHIILWKELPEDFPRKTEDILKDQKKYLPVLLDYTSKMNHTKTLTDMTEKAMESINMGLVQSVAGKENIDFVIDDAVKRNPSEAKEEGIRKGRHFIMATDIKSKDSSPGSPRAFHEQLRAKLYGNEMDLSLYEGRSRDYVSKATENVKVDTAQDRKRMLETIYRFGRMTVKSPSAYLQNDKHYQKWREANSIFNDKDGVIRKLRDELDILNQPSKNNHKSTQRSISALENAISVITKLEKPVSDDDRAYYYLQLRDLRAQTKTYLEPSILHSAIKLFTLPKFKNKSQKLIDEAIKGMLYPGDVKQLDKPNDKERRRTV